MKLQADFPFMQRESTSVYGNIYRRWGCECGDGWYALIYELCNEITRAFKLDILLRSEIKKIVKAFEERSTNTCEICGNDGHLRKDTIIKSMCDNCYMKWLKKQKRKVD